MTGILEGLNLVHILLAVVVTAATVGALMRSWYSRQANAFYSNCPIGQEMIERIEDMCDEVKEMNERGKKKAILDEHRDNILDALTDASVIQLRYLDGEHLNGEVKTLIKSVQYHKQTRREAQNKLVAEEVNHG